MKKLSLLSLMLALAACGGGSGGGGSHSSTPSSAVTPGTLTVPSSLRSGVTSVAAESNKNVTKMNSEVIVATSTANPGGVVVSRSGSRTATEGGYTFTSYMLDDIKFYAADAVTTQNGYLKLDINDETGRIEDMKMVVGGASADAVAGITRNGETSYFKAPIFEYIQDTLKYTVEDTGQDDAALEGIRSAQSLPSKGYWLKDNDNNTWNYYKLEDEAAFRMVGTDTTDMDALNTAAANKPVGHWNRTYEHLPVVTYGGDIDGNGTKLQYADFGSFNPVYENKQVFLNGGGENGGDATKTWTVETSKGGESKPNSKFAQKISGENYQLFAGGYAISGNSMSEDRPSLDPINGQVYKGMAIGRVYASLQGGNDTLEHKRELLTAYGIAYDPAADLNTLQTTEVGRDISKTFTTYNAEMRITQSGGKTVQTLKMPFYTDPTDVNNKYYDVEIKKTGNDIDYVHFDADGHPDTGAGSESNEVAAQYRLYGADEHWDTNTASFNPGYYGVNTPSEAAGTARIKAEQNTIHNGTREYEVQAAYGMKLQQQP